MTVRYLQVGIVGAACAGLLISIWPLMNNSHEMPRHVLEKGTEMAAQLRQLRGSVGRNLNGAQLTVHEASERLESYALPVGDPFAFKPPERVTRKDPLPTNQVAKQPSKEEPQKLPPPPPPRKESWPALKLLGIAYAGDGSVASINGITYRVGEPLRDHETIKVAEIAGNGVTLISDISGEKRQLSIEGRQPKRKANE